MSYHEIMNDAVMEKIRAESTGLGIYFDYKDKLLQGYFEQDYVDAIMDPYMVREIDLMRAAHFADIHTALCMGEVLYCKIRVGKTPGGDTEESYNNKLLSNIPEPYSAKFYGGSGGDNDGNLRWHGKVSVGIITTNGEKIRKSLPTDFSAPLEVGYTEPTTTLLHLACERLLARWPYGSEFIWLFSCWHSNIWRPDFVF